MKKFTEDLQNIIALCCCCFVVVVVFHGISHLSLVFLGLHARLKARVFHGVPLESVPLLVYT